MILKIHNVCKGYNDLDVIHNISVEFTEGLHVIIGYNGCGKTTFLRILATVLKPDSGIITLNNEDIDLMDYKYRELIGYVPQKFGLYNNYTPEKFLMYIASLKGINKKEARKRVNELIQLTNIDEFRSKKIDKLSEGIKKRIVFAQALLNNPKILLLDEPISGLDIESKIWFKDIINSMARDKIVILATHVEGEFYSIAKNIMKIKEKNRDGSQLYSDFLRINRSKS